jgi:hypothetical protein
MRYSLLLFYYLDSIKQREIYVSGPIPESPKRIIKVILLHGIAAAINDEDCGKTIVWKGLKPVSIRYVERFYFLITSSLTSSFYYTGLF